MAKPTSLSSHPADKSSRLEMWTILILGSVPPLRGLFVSGIRKVKALSTKQSSVGGTGPSEPDDSFRLQQISDRASYRANVTPVGKSWRRIDDWSEEDILPSERALRGVGDKEIYVTRDFALKHDDRI